MWYLSIIISIIICIGFIVYLNNLFSKFSKSFFPFNAAMLTNDFNILYPQLSINNKFSNITSNLILKTVIFIVVSLIIHFTDSLIVTFVYVVFVFVAWWVFNKRRNDLNTLSVETQGFFKQYVFKSYITIPIFQTILYLLCYITYLFNI